MPSTKRRGGFESDGDDASDDESPGCSSAQSTSRKRRRISDESAEKSEASEAGSILGEDAEASTPPSDFDTDDEDLLMDQATQAMEKRRSQVVSYEDNIPAEHGILEKVHIVNFMCHKNYEYKLGPLINFICGKNGSGKSAILTAILLCLGGKAAATNRGSSLKDLIRVGADSASITCYIKNQGDGAYQPDVYGDTIQVERHFSRSGPSGFKLKKENGRIVSTKRGDLDDICDHFSLQIENPLNVLTQDAARSFITSSNPSEKYKFFLKGVLLEQLDGDYRLIEEQVENIRPRIIQAAPDVEILEQKFQVAEAKLKATERNKTWQEKIKYLGRLYLWCQVEEQEKLLEGYDLKITAQQEKIDDAERKAAEYQAVADESARLSVEASEAYEKASDAAKDAVGEKAAAVEPFRVAKLAMNEAQGEMRKIWDAIQEARKTIETRKADIAAEEQRLAELDGGGAALRHRELEEAKQAADLAIKEETAHASLKEPLVQDQEAAKREQTKAQGVRDAKDIEVKAHEGRLTDLRKRGQMQDTVFHMSMPQMLKDIQKENRFHNKPIGPIGKHIKLLAPEWSSILEKTFGSTLGGFIVLSKHDENLLQPILRRHKGRGQSPPIHLMNDQLLDLTDKEPHEKYQTIMRVLDIDNEYVRKQLVLGNSIENTALIESLEEASEVTFHERPRNLQRCMCSHPKQRGKGMLLHFRGGRPAQDPVDAWHGTTRMKTNNEVQIKLQEDLVRDTKAEVHQLEDAVRAARDQVVKAGQAIERHKREAQGLKIVAQKAEDKVDALKDAINEDNTRTGSLDVMKEALKTAELNLETNNELHIDAQIHFGAKKKDQKEKQKVLVDFDEQIAELKEVEKAAKATAQQRDVQKTKDERERNRYDEEKLDQDRDLETFQAERAQQQETVDAWTTQAEADSARINIPEGETSRTLSAKWDNVKKRLEDSRKRVGDERVVAEETHKAYTAWQKAKKDLENFEQLQDALDTSVHNRKQRWKRFRAHITVNAKAQFTYLLTERGFRGTVTIDHDSKALDIKVEPDITRQDGSGRSAKTLSGGEKSFSQICLLLAIWEAMGSPIRCLDEFDVFMDAINRTTSVNLMIEAARQSKGKQYILISPGTKSDIKNAPDVHTIEIAAPERGQTRLNFAGS